MEFTRLRFVISSTHQEKKQQARAYDNMFVNLHMIKDIPCKYKNKFCDSQ